MNIGLMYAELVETGTFNFNGLLILEKLELLQLAKQGQELSALKEHLKSIEWSGRDRGYDGAWCPACNGCKECTGISKDNEGHKDNCWLHAAIK